ncbi:M48 family metalloprotease [Pannus brasiliensis CCIBt3594]|uniref:M48 family metalloprotease n=1 Tax=Pannus brasiliensis CCIBt3594 TaxID=1427578 RepID=A0AAW9QWL2_9CHRO
MNSEALASLVGKLEILARERPNRYKIQVAILAFLGYAYILLVLVALAIPIALLIALIIYGRVINAAIVKFILVLSIPVFLILRSLWDTLTMKFPRPKGLELSRAETPRLFEAIDRVKVSLRCPPVDRVLLTGDYNAAIVQIPRLGLLGWEENYLLIGLPLLQSLTVREFTSVLAHEFGHLSGNHGRFQGWIYRLRRTWALLFDRMAGGRGQGSNALFERFFAWYIPFFSAYSFVLARADEYEADRCAVSIAGRDATTSALIEVNVRSRRADNDFWKPLYQRVIEEADPPRQPFTDLGNFLRTEIPPERARELLEQALALPTDLADTHPCLSDRLRAIGCNLETIPTFLFPTGENAADYLLGDFLPSSIERLNEDWQTAISFRWKEEHARSREVLRRLEELDRQSAYRTLLIEEAWERASLTGQIRGDESALPLLRSLLQRDPGHVGANFLLGQILLSRGDVTGIEYLESAMAKNPAIVIEGCQILANFFYERGNMDEVHRYRERAEIHYGALQRANAERANVTANDRFLPHDLSIETVNALCRQLSTHPEIRAAYLVRKAVETFPEMPFYVLGIVRHRGAFEWNGGAPDIGLVKRLAETLQCPGQTWIVLLNSSNRRLARSLRDVNNSAIYS